jgi:MYXO-CTERM domain-containing protein
MWDELLDQGHRVTGVSGSDDHRSPLMPDADDSQIGTPTSMVWAEELSEAAIMDAVKAGRVVVKLRGPDDPMLELTAATDRDESGMIGDTVTGGTVSLTARTSGADGMELVLVRNGEVDETVAVSGDEFEHRFERETDAGGDRYRAHLVADATEVVITNHVWVEYADPVDVPDEPGAEPDDDEGGCGCRAGSQGGGAGAIALAIAAFAIRRRRSRR